jgi:hypothetical protein
MCRDFGWLKHFRDRGKGETMQTVKESKSGLSREAVMAFIGRYKGRIGVVGSSWLQLSPQDAEVAEFLRAHQLLELDGSKQNFRLNQNLWECRSCAHFRSRSNPYSYDRCDATGKNLSQMIMRGHGRICGSCLNGVLSGALGELDGTRN